MLFRIFRQSERARGDDAGLLHFVFNFPEGTGQIGKSVVEVRPKIARAEIVRPLLGQSLEEAAGREKGFGLEEDGLFLIRDLAVPALEVLEASLREL